MSLEAFLSDKRRVMDNLFEATARQEAEYEQLLLHGWGAPPPSEEQVEKYRRCLNASLAKDTDEAG